MGASSGLARLVRRLVAAIVVTCAACLPAAGVAEALPLLGHEGRWITDPVGRVVILHGVQIDRFRPGTVVRDVDLAPEHIPFIASQGFNEARPSISYSGVEPALGHFDDAYIARFRELDQRLAAAGLYDVVDFQQGQYAQPFYGDGFPDWMVDTGGVPPMPQPFPLGYELDLGQNAAWDHFWANVPAADGVGFQDHYAIGLERVAAAFADAPGLVGLEIVNEPWPGTVWPVCASPLGCLPGVFDQTALTGFYRKVDAAIRDADQRHLVVFEPNVLFDYGAATQIGAIDPNGLFAFHNYCLGEIPGLPAIPDPAQLCGVNENVVFSQAEARTASTGDALLLDEWGNFTTEASLARVTRESDEHMVGWSYWAYEDCCGSPASVIHDGTKPPGAPGNLNLPVLRLLVRPYPKAVAGTPEGWSYDPASRRFHFAYSTERAGGGTLPSEALTEVEVPPLHYPTGYSVESDGAAVVSPPDADPLRLRAEPGVGRVEVTVTPADHHTPAQGAPQSAGLAGSCDLGPQRLRIDGAGKGRVALARLLVDGRPLRVAKRHPKALTVGPGLTDGSVVTTIARTDRGFKVVTTRRVRGCRLTSVRRRVVPPRARANRLKTGDDG